MATFTEENYLKAIFKLAERGEQAEVSTTALAEALRTRAASVSEMLRRLADKGTVHYERYRGVRLTETGRLVALRTIRQHRLWEVFLVEKLGFSWDEVHEVAEELEHVNSELLITRLDAYLGFPTVDPHGDPIPTADGEAPVRPAEDQLLAQVPAGSTVLVAGLLDTSARFLQHLDQLGLRPGVRLQLLDRYEYDGTVRVRVGDDAGTPDAMVSRETAQKVFVQAMAA